jgi:hypothetical protein
MQNGIDLNVWRARAQGTHCLPINTENRPMKRHTLFATAATAIVLSVGATLIAQNPGVTIDEHRNPNLNAAQRFLQQAIARTSEAQQANKDDMEGHAARAKEFMDQADAELKLAAEAADRHHH